MKKQPKNHRIGIRIDGDLKKRIERIAESERREMSDMIRLMIEDRVNEYEEIRPIKAKKKPPPAKAGNGTDGK